VYTRSISAASNVPGTRIVTVSQGTHGYVKAFEVTSNALYWYTIDDQDAATSDFDLRTTPLSGGTYATVPAVAGAADARISAGGYYVPALQPLGDTLYFTRSIDSSVINGIYRYKTGDSSPTQIVSADLVTTIMVDASYVYYTRQNVNGVFRAPLTGAAPEQVSTGNASRLVGQDNDFVYAISSSCCLSQIYKIIKHD
jgi:hypothetical protein